MPTKTKIKEVKFHAPLSDVMLDEHDGISNKPAEWVEVLRAGNYAHPDGPLKITTGMIDSMVKNFHDGVRKIDLAVDYAHANQSIAAGWFKDVKREGKTLMAKVKWTSGGNKVLSDGEFRYLSAEFNLNHKDVESGDSHGPTLMGAGLTNRPFVKGMEPVIKFADDQTMNPDSIMTPQEMTAAIQAMQAQITQFVNTKAPAPVVDGDSTDIGDEGDASDSEDGTETGDDADENDSATDSSDVGAKVDDAAAKAADANSKVSDAAMAAKKAKLAKDKKGAPMTDAEKKQMEDTKAKLDAANKKLAEYEEKEAQAKEEKLFSERKASFDVMLSDGKAVEAQRDAFMKQDFAEFTKHMAAPKTIRLSESGEGTNELPGATDAQDELIAKANVLLSEKKAANLGSAISMVLSDPANKDLRTKYEAGTYAPAQE